MSRIFPKKWVPPTTEQDIFNWIKKGKAIPVLGNSVSNELLLGSHHQLIVDYADYVDYPLADKNNLAHVTQYVTTMMAKQRVSSEQIKQSYLQFIKERLCELAEKEGTARNLLDDVTAEFNNLSFSELADRLGYPKFTDPASDPLLILAGLNLPIYLTTGYHRIMEAALRKAGKEPHAGICRWNDKLKGDKQLEKIFPSDIFANGYEPSPQEPLVYYLHGIDECPNSLVLTEDDHLEYLVAISKDMKRLADRIHANVREALTQSSLLLLGYDIENWEFRTLFWGLLKSREKQERGVSVIHLQLSCDQEIEFLKNYLDEEEFDVSLDSIQAYTGKLYNNVLASS